MNRGDLNGERTDIFGAVKGAFEHLVSVDFFRVDSSVSFGDWKLGSGGGGDAMGKPVGIPVWSEWLESAEKMLGGNTGVVDEEDSEQLVCNEFSSVAMGKLLVIDIES